MTIKEVKNTESTKDLNSCDADSLVSFLTELPEPINEAMQKFIEAHPNWDQYRLIQAALAGFLVQNGVESRSINRLYFENMFSKKSVSKPA
ncbi:MULTISPECIES: DUF2811 domain-containing protein [unclassified Prochlorococcus]|uniref:DUF2811 domain-containing protein n=1 Tax=unclassified Prochlorococcus TaxID=2627481 RepID=UPI0005339DA2|nr:MULTISPECIES: DUF2811 domain-containing protein [unclassified Prochlorococcus]KGG15597.1 hypothetical protein EV06_1471 [Prochlorococcus sp. MIT 0602]KGG17877.1 hypothetical protein EV07_1320 [Prochlorococcus sp. MIT 0603]